MAARVTKCNGTMITIETTMDIGGSMLQAEESIQAAVNEVGVVATGEALKRFDADGEVIVVGGTKWYAKAPEEKYFQTPYRAKNLYILFRSHPVALSANATYRRSLRLLVFKGMAESLACLTYLAHLARRNNCNKTSWEAEMSFRAKCSNVNSR